MKRLRIIEAFVVLLFFGNSIQADVGQIVNGSFEDNNDISDITVQEPNGWDVNIPDTDKFTGYVSTDWPTDGSYNLTLYSQWDQQFEANDLATVSQQVDLADVNKIWFDLRLDTYLFGWDPNIATALLLIDGNAVWESNNVGSDVQGEYPDQAYKVDPNYAEGNPHTLSLGLRVNVGGTLNEFYMTDWDYVEFEFYCGGNGFLAADFSRDCSVDERDLRMLADMWQKIISAENKYNLYPDDDLDPLGVIDFRDFAVFANSWLTSSYD